MTEKEIELLSDLIVNKIVNIPTWHGISGTTTNQSGEALMLGRLVFGLCMHGSLNA